jgi:hypothetical protein
VKCLRRGSCVMVLRWEGGWLRKVGASKRVPRANGEVPKRFCGGPFCRAAACKLMPLDFLWGNVGEWLSKGKKCKLVDCTYICIYMSCHSGAR